MPMQARGATSAAVTSEKGDPRVLLAWFENRPAVPLTPPPRFREYGPLSDDNEPSDALYPVRYVEGITFGMEYLDLRGWLSTRTVRCIAFDPARPARLQAYCNVRKSTRAFRLDRIISTTNLRTGVTTQGGAERVLFAPAMLPDEATCTAFRKLVEAARPGVFVLLALAMQNGWLSQDARDVVLDHVRSEAEHRGLTLPPADLLSIWLDNLSPGRSSVLEAVSTLLEDRAEIVRLLPRILQIRRTFSSATQDSGSLQDLVKAFRMYLLPRAPAQAVDLVAWR